MIRKMGKLMKNAQNFLTFFKSCIKKSSGSKPGSKYGCRSALGF